MTDAPANNGTSGGEPTNVSPGDANNALMNPPANNTGTENVFKKDAEGKYFGKYKTDVDFAKAFETLESENGKLRREKTPTAPEKYEYDFSKDEKLKDFDMQKLSPVLLGEAETLFRKYNIPQEAANDMASFFIKQQLADIPNKEAEMAKLGDQKDEVIAKVTKGFEKLGEVKGITPAMKDEYLALASTAEGAKLILHLTGMTGEQSQPGSDANGSNDQPDETGGFKSLDEAQKAYHEFEAKLGGKTWLLNSDKALAEEKSKLLAANRYWQVKEAEKRAGAMIKTSA